MSVCRMWNSRLVELINTRENQTEGDQENEMRVAYVELKRGTHSLSQWSGVKM